MRAFVVIFLFAIVGLYSLATSPFYTSHDGFTHTARIAAYKKILADGQIPPRWAADLNGNLGSPIFVYSYPLPYLIGSAVHTLGFSYQDSFRIVMALSFVLGPLGMYLWLKNKYGTLSGIVSAIFYMFVPYRFLNLYVRAAFAESFAYALLPFLFLSVDKYRTEKNKALWWSLTTVLTSLLLLSHNVVAAIFLPFVFVWIILTFWKKWLSSLKLLFALGTGFLISSFIYLPDLFERHFIRFDQGISYYKDHFVEIGQLIRSPWGYGFDLPGTVNDAMSFQLGLAQLLILGLLLLIIILKRPKSLELYFFLGVLFVTILLMVNAPYSVTLWQTLPMLSTIVDFPWRFLGMTAFIFAFLAGFLVKLAPFKLALVVILLLAVLIANRNFTRVNERLSYEDKVFENYTGTSTATSNEYQPIYIKTLTKDQTPILEIAEGTIKTKLLLKNSHGLKFVAKATSPAILKINRAYFPDTVIYRNGIRVDNSWKINTYGTITLDIVPPGGTYDLKFVETPLRNFANIISTVSLISTLTVLVLALIKRNEKV